MNNDIEKTLSQYIDLPKNVISDFSVGLTYCELEPFEYFAKTNEHTTSFFILKSGLIRSFLETEDGKQVTKFFFTPPNFTGSLASLIKNIPYDLNYQALTKVTGYKGCFLKLKELTLKNHDFSLFYIKAMENSYLKAENVIIDISTHSATERYLILKERIPTIDNLIAQRYIASYLNVSPVQLSRIKKSLLK
ncbi:Crp/Fnr family transcriptional regulator [Tenacibaculum sp. HL-MS23]|uniref:Crp/Fnr family transcriptional regulator n=1 Tax=Tenacibaculum sp. HL-MS23 TaxID=3077734 RepID=UPI0028FC13B5|nr:Crp/Fnr family transcriptional regulator [Tenacibaculum sp. HL-MS23]WNW01966.1 Crp/Fnr family transcriptional regulator [Tenacibaculum sp. HL-MS23]